MRKQVKPTRAELRDLKRRLGIVRRGHALLERKQESLMVELFRALDRYRNQVEKTATARRDARAAAALSEMAVGRYASWGYAMRRAGCKGVEARRTSYMGVRLPHYALVDREAIPFLPGEQPQCFDAAHAAQTLLGHCMAQAEIEATIAALIDEIERTKRRVNALELKVIPQLEEDAAFILSRLEEMERESLFSLKRIRAKLASR